MLTTLVGCGHGIQVLGNLTKSLSLMAAKSNLQLDTELPFPDAAKSKTFLLNAAKS